MKKHYPLFCALILCLFSIAASAQKMYLKADYLTENLGQDRDFEDYVNITSLQYGMTAATTILKGGSPSVGKPQFGEVIVTKSADALSGKEMEYLALGKHFDNVEIVNTMTDGLGKIRVMYKVELQDAFVTDVSTSSVPGCNGNCPSASESLKLVFKAIRVTTYYINSRGEVKANPSFVFNVSQQNTTWP
jgi:type VI protein secretion system component Hcp